MALFNLNLTHKIELIKYHFLILLKAHFFQNTKDL